jgi:hypothetical protein
MFENQIADEGLKANVHEDLIELSSENTQIT